MTMQLVCQPYDTVTPQHHPVLLVLLNLVGSGKQGRWSQSEVHRQIQGAGVQGRFLCASVKGNTAPF